MNKTEIADWDDAQVENTLRVKSQEECKLTLEVIDLLSEMDRRKLYLKRGFGSLIEYCVKELKYSESSAYRRISAMRVMRDVPETKSSIETGALNLSTVSQAQTFFRAEAKNRKTYSREEKKNVLTQLQNKSAREAEKVLLQISPGLEVKEKIRQVAEDKTQVTLIMPEQLMQKLNKLNPLLSHQKPDCNYTELIEILADLALKKLDPVQIQSRVDIRKSRVDIRKSRLASHKSKAASRESQLDSHKSRTAAPTSEPGKVQLQEIQPQKVQSKKVKLQQMQPAKRYISAAVRRAVWEKSNGRCCYRDKDSGRRCGSTRFLELDHIHPHSLGGASTIKNLQLLCDGHNRLKGNALEI